MVSVIKLNEKKNRNQEWTYEKTSKGEGSYAETNHQPPNDQDIK
jgi:hypothetical protein